MGRIAASGADAHPALEILWTLHQTGALDEAAALRTLRHGAPMVRAWTIRLAGDARKLSPEFYKAVLELAATEPDAEVRSQILSTARRVPQEQALPLVAAILTRDVDAKDAFIPLMAWYVVESHCGSAAEEVIALFGRQPDLWGRAIVRSHITPRLMRRFAAAGGRADLLHAARLLALAPAPEDKAALMEGFGQAFQGRTLPVLPQELAEAMATMGKGSLLLRLRRQDAAAKDEALAILANPASPAADRLQMVRIFGEIQHPPARDALLGIAKAADSSVEMANSSLAALTLYDDPRIGAEIAAALPGLPRDRRGAALALL
ncbi:MAG: dehydrogenase, partial [Acetobacteraceae bacterium]